MARSANSENIRRDEDGPDFESVIGLVRGKLRSNDADQRSLAQDNATLFTRIEKQHGVHKGAAKTFVQIDRMAPEKRTDYLRSLIGLLNFAGYDNFDDLVDRAQRPEGKAAPKKAPAGGKGTKAQAPDALEEDISKAPVDPEIAAQREADAAEFEEGNVHPFPAQKH
jgi:hypothetical protein